MGIFLDPPGPPENLTVTEMFNDHCTLSWQPPKEDGGAEVTGYVIERRLAGSTRWVVANKEPVTDVTTTLGDLVDGNEYEFRVTAENKVGQGAPSEPTKPVLAKDPWTKPGKPEQLAVENARSHAVALSWQPPADNGGADVTNYVIEYRKEGKN